MKNVWKIVLIGIILGIALMIAGLIAGAKDGIYFDRGGIQIGEKRIKETIFNISSLFSSWDDDYHDYRDDDDIRYFIGDEDDTITKLGTEAITGIDINVINASINIVIADDYGYSITNYDDSRVPIKHKLENGILAISQDSRRWGWSFGFDFDFWQERNRVTVYLPSDAVLNNVLLEAISGRIDIEAIICDRLSVDTTSGSISLSDCTADDINVEAISGGIHLNNSIADDINISVVSGSIKSSGTKANGFTSDSISGSTTVEGELLGQTRIDSASGSVRLTIHNNGEKYQKNLSSLSGSIYVNGDKMHGKSVVDTESSKNKINIDVLSGSIHLDFEK